MLNADSPGSGIPTFYLLRPERVPKGRRAFPPLAPVLRESVLAACTGGTPLSDRETLARVYAALGLARVDFQSVGEGGHPRGAVADGTAHDTYCHVARVTGEEPRIFLYSILQAYGELLEERLAAGTSIEGGHWLQLRAALESILFYVLGQPVVASPELHPPPPASAGQPDPVRRWILGHHVFLALIQGLIVAAHDLADALAGGRQSEAAAAFEQCGGLLEGSALAFRFASDFSAVDYNEVVRLTMMPPVAPPGLSGLLSADHRYLIKVLAALKPSFEALEPDLCSSYQHFRTAFRAAYDAHKLVCGHFSGDEKPSLLMKAESEMSAVERLDQFKQRRLRMLPAKPGSAD
jgi:hypothetical protein